MSITMKDVAKLAGVSVSTVSRVINNSSLVREETAIRVRRAIDKLDYQLNESARILRTNYTNLIGVIGAGMEHPFLTRVLKGIETSALEHDYNLLYGDSDGELEQELNYLKIMKQKKIAGIIIISASIYSDLITQIKEEQLPVVFGSGYILDPEITCVTVDNVAAAYDATTFLIKNKFAKFGIIRGPFSDMVASEERMRGVRLALTENDIELNSELIIEGDFSFTSGYAGARQLLQIDPSLKAVFAFNDEMAIGAIRYLEDRGNQIPEDIWVIGFDDIKISRFVRPSLSTVAQSGLELGSRCVSMLDRLIRDLPLPEKKVFISHKLVLRESTGHKGGDNRLKLE